jgi:hypothetical protein
MAYGAGHKVHPRNNAAPRKPKRAPYNVLADCMINSHGEMNQAERIPSIRIKTGGRCTPASRSRKPKAPGKYLGPKTENERERQMVPLRQAQLRKDLWARLCHISRTCGSTLMAERMFAMNCDKLALKLSFEMVALGVPQKAVDDAIMKAARLTPQREDLGAERVVFELAPQYLHKVPTHLPGPDGEREVIPYEDRMKQARGLVRQAIRDIARLAKAGDLTAQQWMNRHLSRKAAGRLKRHLSV